MERLQYVRAMLLESEQSIRTRGKKQRPRFKNVSRLVILVGLMQSFHHTEARSPRQIKGCKLKRQFYSEDVGHCVQCTTYKNCDLAFWKDIERCRNACRKGEPSTTKPPNSQTHTIGSKATTRPPDVRTAENEQHKLIRILVICAIIIGAGLILLIPWVICVIYNKYAKTRPSEEPPRQLEEIQHPPEETPRQMEATYRPLEEVVVEWSSVDQSQDVINNAERSPSIISDIYEELSLSSSLEETEEFEEV